jgi:hypothetical protein
LKLFQEWGEGSKGEWWRGEFNYDTCDILHNNNKNKGTKVERTEIEAMNQFGL